MKGRGNKAWESIRCWGGMDSSTDGVMGMRTKYRGWRRQESD